MKRLISLDYAFFSVFAFLVCALYSAPIYFFHILRTGAFPDTTAVKYLENVLVLNSLFLAVSICLSIGFAKVIHYAVKKIFVVDAFLEAIIVLIFLVVTTVCLIYFEAGILHSLVFSILFFFIYIWIRFEPNKVNWAAYLGF